MCLDSFSYHGKKINSRQSIALTLKGPTIKLLEENIGQHTCNLGGGRFEKGLTVKKNLMCWTILKLRTLNYRMNH